MSWLGFFIVNDFLGMCCGSALGYTWKRISGNLQAHIAYQLCQPKQINEDSEASQCRSKNLREWTLGGAKNLKVDDFADGLNNRTNGGLLRRRIYSNYALKISAIR